MRTTSITFLRWDFWVIFSLVIKVMADSASSALVIVLNTSIYISTNWTLTKLYDTSLLESPFYKNGQKRREVK